MTRMKLFAFGILLLAPFLLHAQTHFQNIASSDYASAHVLVRFKPGVNDSVQRKIHKQLGTRELARLGSMTFVSVSVPKGKSAPGLVRAFAVLPQVAWAQLDYVAHVSAIVNDPFFSYQWHFERIGIPAAWDLAPTPENVVVAVLDTGIRIPSGGDGVEILMAGYNAISPGDPPLDGDGHGTHVSGTIAQHTNNMMGVAGMASGVQLLPVKVLDDDGNGFTSWIADGLKYATDQGADVVNMSLGYPLNIGDPGPALSEAIQYAHQHGVTLVAATGNDGSKKLISYPAAYDEVIAVGATRFDNTVVRYSNRGEGIDLVAPGGDISVDQNGDGYGDGVLQETFSITNGQPVFGYYFYQGTSMAAPHVSGAAALIVAAGIDTPSDVRFILRQSALDMGARGWDIAYGAGLLNVRKAVALALSPTMHCWSDGDCDDGDTCTTDTCTRFGTVAAYCSHTLPPCGVEDGCCDTTCTPVPDPDCSGIETCGDNYCVGTVLGEDCTSCPNDCARSNHPVLGEACCGDGACTGRETVQSCEVDCLQTK
ncbi:MAG: peptidase S8 [Deltaproteobacteria bacterium]|nr:peptidase S8 [Deltaproteobacteria bacterium]